MRTATQTATQRTMLNATQKACQIKGLYRRCNAVSTLHFAQFLAKSALLCRYCRCHEGYEELRCNVRTATFESPEFCAQPQICCFSFTFHHFRSRKVTPRAYHALLDSVPHHCSLLEGLVIKPSCRNREPIL